MTLFRDILTLEGPEIALYVRIVYYEYGGIWLEKNWANTFQYKVN